MHSLTVDGRSGDMPLRVCARKPSFLCLCDENRLAKVLPTLFKTNQNKYPPAILPDALVSHGPPSLVFSQQPTSAMKKHEVTNRTLITRIEELPVSFCADIFCREEAGAACAQNSVRHIFKIFDQTTLETLQRI